MSAAPASLDMKAILADKSNRVVVCCGAGGVGKTTTAAAMALRAAEYGRSVVVLTIDPARRLAQALGIKELGNSAFRVASLWGRFHVGSALAEALSDIDGPILLVDDLVDSRWTFTLAARELRAAGATSVLPFALASLA